VVATSTLSYVPPPLVHIPFLFPVPSIAMSTPRAPATGGSSSRTEWEKSSLAFVKTGPLPAVELFFNVGEIMKAIITKAKLDAFEARITCTLEQVPGLCNLKDLMQQVGYDATIGCRNPDQTYVSMICRRKGSQPSEKLVCFYYPIRAPIPDVKPVGHLAVEQAERVAPQ